MDHCLCDMPEVDHMDFKNRQMDSVTNVSDTIQKLLLVKAQTAF